MTTAKIKRLSVSLSQELADWAHKKARETNQPVSSVVAQALRKASREERNAIIMAELIADAAEENILSYGPAGVVIVDR